MGYLMHWYLEASRSPDVLWTGIGFVGTALFGVRFLIQWLSSERKGHSVIPVAFWYFSLIGGTISLFYALHPADPGGQRMGREVIGPQARPPALQCLGQCIVAHARGAGRGKCRDGERGHVGRWAWT